MPPPKMERLSDGWEKSLALPSSWHPTTPVASLSMAVIRRISRALGLAWQAITETLSELYMEREES